MQSFNLALIAERSMASMREGPSRISIWSECTRTFLRFGALGRCSN